MNNKFSLIFGVLLGLFVAIPQQSAAFPPIPQDPPLKVVRILKAGDDFAHNVGRSGSHGWELDYSRHKPGYALTAPHEPVLLEPGAYRATFILRRGKFPKKGLLNETYGVFRLEVWDATTNERLNARELQRCDFSSANKYERRWLEFSMRGREGHLIEPRVYWFGLSNGEVEAIELSRFPDVSLKELREKAERIGRMLERNHLENGFVVSRQRGQTPSTSKGSDPFVEPDETGDATTYTGWYVASLAWKYAVTHDELTYQSLENGLQTLHNAVKGTPDQPMIARFVDADGTPFSKAPSKDVYTAFFFAYAAAFPHLKNTALKNQMSLDADRIATRFLKDGLTIKSGPHALVSLTPYFTEEEIRSGIHAFLPDRKKSHAVMKAINQVPRYLPFTELWSGMNEVLHALKTQDEDQLFLLTLPTMNGAGTLLHRTRDVLREQYREDLFPRRFHNQDYPGRRLSDLLSKYLKTFPERQDGQRFQRISDLRVLASNALISLHILRAAERITRRPQFEEYLKSNLYTQDALLKCALDWSTADEDLMRLTVGNPTADRMRKGYLSALSLYQLIQAEPNPAVKEKYQMLLSLWWESYKNEDNPMAAALSLASGGTGEVDLILHDLDLYPENRDGFGDDYWRDNGKKIAEDLGGGEYQGFSREPLPVSHRPKDSFLWQRNARRLEGDHDVRYPGTDYLFVYWLCRYHHIIPTEQSQPVAHP